MSGFAKNCFNFFETFNGFALLIEAKLAAADSVVYYLESTVLSKSISGCIIVL